MRLFREIYKFEISTSVHLKIIIIINVFNNIKQILGTTYHFHLDFILLKQFSIFRIYIRTLAFKT